MAKIFHFPVQQMAAYLGELHAESLITSELVPEERNGETWYRLGTERPEEKANVLCSMYVLEHIGCLRRHPHDHLLVQVVKNSAASKAVQA